MNVHSRRRFGKQINTKSSDCVQKDGKDYFLESRHLFIEGTAKLAFWSSIKRSTTITPESIRNGLAASPAFVGSTNIEGRRSVSLDAERDWGEAGFAADFLDGCCRSRGVEGGDEPNSD